MSNKQLFLLICLSVLFCLPHRALEEATGRLHGPFPQCEDSPNQKTGRADKDPDAGGLSSLWGCYHILGLTL